MELPGPDEKLPEDIELRISRLAVPAAEQLTGKAQMMAQAEQNAKQSQDPVDSDATTRVGAQRTAGGG